MGTKERNKISLESWHLWLGSGWSWDIVNFEAVCCNPFFPTTFWRLSLAFCVLSRSATLLHYFILGLVTHFLAVVNFVDFVVHVTCGCCHAWLSRFFVISSRHFAREATFFLYCIMGSSHSHLKHHICCSHLGPPFVAPLQGLAEPSLYE